MKANEWPDEWPGRDHSLTSWPHIEFFYLDAKHPLTPSHVWWSGRALGVAPESFHGPFETRLSAEAPIAFIANPIELREDPKVEGLSLTDLRTLQNQVRGRM